MPIAKIVFDGLESVTWQRLYRLEIQKLESPVAGASTHTSGPRASRFERAGRPTLTRGSRPQPPHEDPRWRRFALIYDVHDRSTDELMQDVLDAVEGETKRFRVRIFYWEGNMVTPEAGKLLGRGQDFLYSDNPRGETISMVEEPIEFEIKDE